LPVPTGNAGTFVYDLLSVRDASSTACEQVQSGQAVITVNPLPTATISGTTTVCKDELSPIITFTGSSGLAPYTFTYTVDGGSNQTVTTTVGSSVTVTVPTGIPGVFDYELISVEDDSPTGCTQLQPGNAIVTVNPLPTATISGTTTVCKNDPSPSITFTGSDGTAPYIFTYTINSGSPLTVPSLSGNSISVPVSTANAGTFTYALVSVQDASSTTCSQIQGGGATVLVNPLPEATISGTTTVCRDDPFPNITFTGSSGTPPYTFSYTIDGGSVQSVTTSVGSSISIQVPTGSAGVFTYDLVSVQDAIIPSCSQIQEGSAVVTVNQLPIATIIGSTVVCQDDVSPYITFTGSSGTAPYTFSYTINSGNIQVVSTSGGNSLSLPVPTDVTGTFTYALVSVEDASSTSCSQIQVGSATVIVNPLPTATISGTTAVCKNAAFPVVTFTGFSGLAPYTFIYTINGGSYQSLTSVGNTVTLPVPTDQAGLFTYELLSVQDASSTSCSQEVLNESAVITINPLPEATISGDTEICRYDALPDITFTGSSGLAPYTFTYNINGGSDQFISTTTGNSVTLPAPTVAVGIFDYNLTGIHDARVISCYQAQDQTATVTVNPLPATSAISGNQTPACEGIGEIYSVTLTTGSSYAWTVPTGSIITAGATGPNNNSITVNFGTNSYNVSVIETNSNGCTGTQINLPVSLQGCALDADFTASSTSVCSGSSVTFTDLSSGVSGSTTYSWDFGTGAAPDTASGIVPHIVTYTGSGPRTVELTITEGASDTETKADYITVNPLPTATISGTTAVCKDAVSPNITFTGDSGTAPYTFTYIINGGSNQTVTTTAGNSVTVPVPTDTAGTFTYALVSVQESSSTACLQVQTDSAVVIVNPLPTATISGTTAVCKDAATPDITFTGSSGTEPYTFTYTINSGSNQTVTTTAGNSVIVPVPTDTAGTFTYSLVSVQDASSTACLQAQTDSAVVTVNPLPTATISGTTSVCRDAAFPDITFTGSSGTEPYTFTYTINSGSNLTVTTTSGDSVSVPVPTDTTGTFTYSLVSVQDASSTGCSQAQSDSAVVTVNSLPTATISGTTAVCRNSASPDITFTRSSGTAPYTFTYIVNSGSNQTVTTISGNSVTVPVPTGTAGTFTYSLVSVQDASTSTCSQAQTGNAVVTVNAYPTADAGSGGDECDLDFVLQATSSVGTGVWTMTDGTGTAMFSPNTNYSNAVVTVTEYGTKEFTWTEVNGTCSDTATIEVNFFEQPVTNAGTGGDECDLDFVLNDVSGTGTGTWSMTAGTGTASYSPDTNTPNAVVTVTDYGTKEFIWTEINGSCSDNQSVTVNFYELPVANPGVGGNICGLGFNLQATPSYGVGTWTITSAPGNVTFSPDQNAPNASVVVDAFGTYELTWTEVNGTCSDHASIVITFFEIPLANAGTGGEECDLDFALNAIPGNGTGAWTLTSGPGNATFTPDQNHPDATVTVDQFGSYYFTWTEVNNICSTNDIIQVTFRDLPFIDAGDNLIICVDSTAHLTAIGSGAFYWSPDTIVDNPAFPYPVASPVSSTWFKVLLTDQWGCENTDSVFVEVKPPPVAYAGPDRILEYILETTLEAELGINETGTWSVFIGTGEFFDTTYPATTVSNLSLNENGLIWTVTNEVCPVSSDTVFITVNDLVIPTLITPNMDGRNDYFVLIGIETLGKTKLIIFDRRGAQVYKNSNYDNGWNGVDYNGNPLPDDTYFFIMKTENRRSISGYIVIR